MTFIDESGQLTKEETSLASESPELDLRLKMTRLAGQISHNLNILEF